MRTIDQLLDDVFAGQERMSRDEIHRRAVAANLAADALTTLDALPEGEYSQEEAADAIGQPGADDASPVGLLDFAAEGVPAAELAEDDLLRELASVHRTRNETFLHGSPQALQRHSERTAELEDEYLNRHPDRDVEADRLRSGARQHH